MGMFYMYVPIYLFLLGFVHFKIILTSEQMFFFNENICTYLIHLFPVLNEWFVAFYLSLCPLFPFFFINSICIINNICMMLLLQKTCNLIDMFINGEQRIKTHRYKQNILYNCFHTTRVDLLNQQLVRCFKCSVYALSRKLLSSIKGQINAR